MVSWPTVITRVCVLARAVCSAQNALLRAAWNSSRRGMFSDLGGGMVTLGAPPCPAPLLSLFCVMDADGVCLLQARAVWCRNCVSRTRSYGQKFSGFVVSLLPHGATLVWMLPKMVTTTTLMTTGASSGFAMGVCFCCFRFPLLLLYACVTLYSLFQGPCFMLSQGLMLTTFITVVPDSGDGRLVAFMPKQPPPARSTSSCDWSEAAEQGQPSLHLRLRCATRINP